MKERKIKQVTTRTQRKVSDLVGVDFSITGTKVVRLKKMKGGRISLVGIDLLPALDLTASKCSLKLSKQLTTHYVNLVYSGKEAVARVLNVPLPAGEEMLSDEKLRELLNVSEEYRVSAGLLKRESGRKDSMFLAAAIPESIIKTVLSSFETGAPALASIEVAGLAFISSFLHAQGDKVKKEAVCIVEYGESTTYFAFLNQGMVLLVGRFDFGGAVMRNKISKDLGVDEDLTKTVIVDRSIDVSSLIMEAMMPILKQLSISKDFVERHQSCEISKLYISGGTHQLSCWTEEVAKYLQVEVIPWNPLENIYCAKGVIPESFSDKIASFSVAVGAAIGGLEE